MSINKAQAKLLATNFLDTLGSDPEEFKPVELVTEALTIAGEFASLMQQNCPVHNGKLAASITVEEPNEYGNGGISIDVTMLSYGQFIDKGVRGTKGGSGYYAFKYDMPSKKMVEAIKQYIKTASAATATIKHRPFGKQETKHKRISEAESAFAMARAIKQHGIKPTHFIAKAAQTIDRKYSSVLSDALAKDLYNSLPDKL